MMLLASTDWWTLSAAWVTAIAAVVYAIFTHVQVKALVRQTRMLTEGFVVASFDFESAGNFGAEILVLRNIGSRPVFWVKLNVMGVALMPKLLAAHSVCNDGLPLMNAGESVQIAVSADEVRQLANLGEVVNRTQGSMQEQTDGVPRVLRVSWATSYKDDARRFELYPIATSEGS